MRREEGLLNYTLLWKPKKLWAAIKVQTRVRSSMWRAMRAGERKYRNDPNYRLELVPKYFAPRPGEPADDTLILKRISAAYRRAKADQRTASEAYNVSNEWIHRYERTLGGAMQALMTDDIDALQPMYQNFFRDVCSSGLVGLPIDMADIHAGKGISKTISKCILGDVVHRYQLWKERTNNMYPVEQLVCPDVGNPFGYYMDGVFIRACAEYQHYYSHAIGELLGTGDKRVVAELGGGFGGFAYFLMRDHPGLTYVDFDLPEALALATYYLMKSLPEMPFSLYGEVELGEALTRPGMVMMPSFAITTMPDKSATVFFNSYSLAEMSSFSIQTYIEQIARTTEKYFLHVNHTRHSVVSADDFGVEKHGFKLMNRELAGWTLGTNADSDEFEFLYQA